MRFARMLVSAAPLVGAVLLAPARASADVGKAEASPNGKGIVGGALLGGELVCAVEAAAGVQNGWAYLGGAVGGAAAGGVGGYFLEQNASARASMLVLAGGMTLVIPTVVLVLSQTAYAPPADYITDKPPADEPVANPPHPDAPAPAPAAAPPGAVPPTAAPPPAAAPSPATGTPTSSVPQKRRIARSVPPLKLVPPALVALRPGALALNVPAVEIHDTYTRTELAMYGVTQHTEVHIPVLNVVF
ncbi:MAG TPA: hypothetical protein VNN72_29920 [Polyangiaceae bacterium]|nr:hypothetical protein [Polyangiaceae bacterium]